VGIPPEKQKAIFESFTQGDTSTTRKYGGTGLGTTISKRLVELMHGEIGLSSEVGKGSTFWFTALLENCHEGIPEETMGETESANDQEPRKQTGHILVAEDYATNQEIVKSHLLSAGYTFDLAVNGKEALEMTRRKKFDLILMDVQMPVMDGHEATRRIRTEDTPNARVPIIATTANAYKQDIERCLEAGMDDVVTKPLRRKAFLNIVAKWLSMREEQQLQVWEETQDLSTGPKSETAESSPLNFDDFLENMGIEKQVAFQIIDVFLDDTKEQLSSLMEHIEKQDQGTLKREVHSIKGGAANIRAMSMQLIAQNIEKTIEEGNLEEARKLVPKLEEEYRRIVSYIQTLKS
jgi:CheY-like chemotaxis protein/HPt (histidine-containing phosphotransfer) domain-containing protein